MTREPGRAAAEIAVREIAEFLAAHDRPETVLCTCFEPAVRAAWEAALAARSADAGG